MDLTKQQARELTEQNTEKVLRNMHKQMLRNGKKDRLYAELKRRYPTREIFGLKFPEYIATLEKEIQQEDVNK